MRDIRDKHTHHSIKRCFQSKGVVNYHKLRNLMPRLCYGNGRSEGAQIQRFDIPLFPNNSKL